MGKNVVIDIKKEFYIKKTKNKTHFDNIRKNKMIKYFY